MDRMGYDRYDSRKIFETTCSGNMQQEVLFSCSLLWGFAIGLGLTFAYAQVLSWLLLHRV